MRGSTSPWRSRATGGTNCWAGICTTIAWPAWPRGKSFPGRFGEPWPEPRPGRSYVGLATFPPLAAEGETALAHALIHRSDAGALPAIAGSENVRPSETWLAAFEGMDESDAIHRAMFADAAVYLPDDILTKVDRASMSVGLEARVPVLDHRVVRYALRLPLRWIWRDGLSKAPLREVLYRRVPRELVDRPKRGFGLPIGALLKDDLARWTRHYLSRDRIGEEGLLDPDAVEAWLGQRSSRSSRDLRTLWFLICFERWFASTHRGEEAA